MKLEKKNSDEKINNKIINLDNIFENSSDFDFENMILCLKRDLLLKECSVFFGDMYFYDKNFLKIKKLFKYNFENKKRLNLINEIEKFKCPIKLKNYANNKNAYPQLFVKPYTSFYNLETLRISHPYFKRKGIKKPSFPYLPPHYNILKSIIDNNNKDIYFNEECEVISKTNIIAGNLILNDKFIYFKNNNEIKSQYGKNLKYLFCSMIDDIKIKDKIILIKIKEIQEIISRRYIYDYRAIEIFLKDGKSYYFNLYSPINVNSFFEKIEKMKSEENNFEIIKNPIKYFEEKRYQDIWYSNQLSTYQYLLYVNKFSGRSYNDINQYPIFPWLFLESSLGSHKKEEKLPIFRELYYPISVKKEEDIIDAISFFEANMEEKPNHPCHYRLHYSTSGYLLSFLVRMSPFTEEQIRFQNNQFDSPSRQVHAIDEILTILSSSHDNRELIPEYFTTMEFFLNANYVNFGFRLNDKVMINDVQSPKHYLNTICQYIFYNRLILNLKIPFKEINKDAYFEEELRINDWIDLIFGVRQWDEKPKKDKLNLFGKYCYRQNVNFDKILEKYAQKEYDNKTIISKIESKKARIINFGQCPEVLFKTKHKESILSASEEEINKDEMEIIATNNIDLTIYEKKKNIKLNIVTFWLTNNNINEYLYFLVYEEKKNDEKNQEAKQQSILIYKMPAYDQKEPDYIININEINLFHIKYKSSKNMSNKKEEKYNANGISKVSSLKNERFPSVALNEPNIFSINDELDSQNKRQSDKDVTKRMNSEYKKYKTRTYDIYKISPKNCLFDVFLEKNFYFFVGRNIDNSIKVYEKDLLDKTKEGKLIYSIPTDSFVSCFYKKNNNIFLSGHKNGKLYEWEILYNKDKKNKEYINSIKIKRDLIAHKESMICLIDFIEKHDILITTSNDGKFFVRKYYNFELLSIFESIPENSVISRVIYTDYDLLYLLINHRDKDSENKSSIGIFTLNGLLIESSKKQYFNDIEPLKNGKIFCNDLISTKLGIFGLNEKEGGFVLYDILPKILDIKKENKIVNFIFQSDKNCFYILLNDKRLFMQQLNDFEFLTKGVDKLPQKGERKESIINSGNNNLKEDKIFEPKKSKKITRNGSL